MIRYRTYFLIVASFFVVTLHAQREAITCFESDITIHKDGVITVQEIIRVVAQGKQIKRGIVRELPTIYKSDYGQSVIIALDVQAVQKDGEAEPYTIKDAINGKRIFIGDKDAYLRPGIYTYQIIYTLNRMLGFFADYDELHFNITGLGSRLPIDKVVATIHLPEGVTVDQLKGFEAYTGYDGQQGKDYTVTVRDNNTLVFESTRPFNPQEGLSIAVGWPKGFVDEPTTVKLWYWWFYDNRGFLVVFLGLVLLCGYYFVVFRRIRRGEKDGPIIPLFHPPKDVCPGLMRYIYRMKYDSTVLAADVVNMAVHGMLTIKHTKGWSSGTYELIKKEGDKKDAPFAYYAVVQRRLFASGDSIALTKKNNQDLSEVARIAQSYCKNNGDEYFDYHTNEQVGGVVITAIIAIVALLVDQWAFENPLLLVLIFMVQGTLIARLFDRYTLEGQTIYNQIAGFKLFLETTEKDRIKLVGTPPIKTPELYEKYLPYAIALGVEKQWSHQFAPVFAQYEREGHMYMPHWYLGSRSFSSQTFDVSSFDASSFSSNLGYSFSSAISSSSSVPGSSSGLGGRGSSGSGGGGGGGGGW